MKILLIGSGGREHAIAWKLARAGHTLLCAPGNPGIATVADILELKVSSAEDDLDRIAAAAAERAVDLVVVGPEAPLVAGLADRLRQRGIAVFGPGAVGAQLEGSKIFAKQFFARHDIRTAEFAACTTIAQADRAIDDLFEPGRGVVVKADGLAAGKGVVVASDIATARAAARAMIDDGRFGAAGAHIIVERRLPGRELSVMALTDGRRCEILAQAEDHKAIFDGDRGPNTGGMGTVSPCAWVGPALLERIASEIFAPTLRGLAADGIDYRGVLYAGLMIDGDGAPWLLEYNCRFGDPETQPVLARLGDDLAPWLAGAAAGQLPDGAMTWDPRTAVCVILASPGYPGTSATGRPIRGLASASAEALRSTAADAAVAVDADADDDADAAQGAEPPLVFHAGTAVAAPDASDATDTTDTTKNPTGELLTAGGRVLGITAVADDLAAARAAAYRATATVRFDGMQYRRDIGVRAATESDPQATDNRTSTNNGDSR